MNRFLPRTLVNGPSNPSIPVAIGKLLVNGVSVVINIYDIFDAQREVG
jgi:hypothetical protein